MAAINTIDDARQLLTFGVLPLLSGIGFYGTMYLSYKNGLLQHLVDLVRGKSEAIPNSKQKLIRKWTGIRPIDDYLAFYLAFFLSGSKGSPVTALQNRYFLAQYSAIWALMQLQSHRLESSALIRSSLLFTGFAVQSIGAGSVIPAWCATHLATSLLSKTAVSTFGSISGDRIAAIPASVILSMLLPFVVSTFSRSSLVKQSGLNVWQVYYIFTELFERLLAPILRSHNSELATSRLYAFALGLATVSHVAVVAPVLLYKMAPRSMPGHSNVSFVKIFWPRIQLAREGDMFEARLHFLRWDLAFSALSFVLWAAACYVLAMPRDATTTSDLTRLVGQIVVRLCLTGPAGVAAWLLRERDHLLA